MTHQRRNGQPARVYKTKFETDVAGNKVEIIDEENYLDVKAWVIPQRSGRMEVPGQGEINVVTLGVAVLPDVGLWSRVDYRGEQWDVVAPPAYHHGTRAVRHYSIDLRKRP